MNRLLSLLFVLCFGLGIFPKSLLSQSSLPTVPENGLRVMQLMKNINGSQRYPDALSSLLKMMNEQTWAKFDTDPLYISELTDEQLFENPILYINCDFLFNL